MNSRRNFLGNLLLAGAAFTILPGAGRVWRAQRVFKTLSVGSPFDPRLYRGDWHWIVEPVFDDDWEFGEQFIPTFIRQPPQIRKAV